MNGSRFDRLLSVLQLIVISLTMLSLPSGASKLDNPSSLASNRDVGVALEQYAHSNLYIVPLAIIDSSPQSRTANLTTRHRYHVPDTTIALDFYEYDMGSISPQDVLMCIVEGLSKIFGHTIEEPVPRLSTFYYKNFAFIHIQDYNPTPGREHTYGDMAATLRGIGEWMMERRLFQTLEFQIWSITPTSELKIGSGGVGGMLGKKGPGNVTTPDESTS